MQHFAIHFSCMRLYNRFASGIKRKITNFPPNESPYYRVLRNQTNFLRSKGMENFCCKYCQKLNMNKREKTQTVFVTESELINIVTMTICSTFFGKHIPYNVELNEVENVFKYLIFFFGTIHCCQNLPEVYSRK